MNDPALVGTTIAIGELRRSRAQFPHGANARRPAQLFLTVHGIRPTWSTPPGGSRVDSPPAGVDRRSAAGRSRSSSRTAPGIPGTGTSGSRPGSASGTRQRAATWSPGAAADADPPGRRRRPGEPDRVLQRRLPLRRAAARPSDRPARACSPTRPGGAIASRRTRSPAADLSPLPRRSSTSASSSAGVTDDLRGQAARRSARGPDEPDPREPLRDRAGRRLRAVLRRSRPTARASCAAGCSPTRSTSRGSPAADAATG